MLDGICNNRNLLQMTNYETANPYFPNGSVSGSLFTGTNSIYNFNPLQSLTGGYNPLQQMFLGGGCNIFTNCNGTPNWGGMLGFGIGNSLVNSLKMYIGHAVSTRRENSAETIEADVNDLNDQKEVILDKVDSTEDEIMNFNIENTKEANVYNEAVKAYNTNEAAIKAYTDDQTNIESIIRRYTATTLAEGETKPTEAEYNTAKAKKDAYTEAIANRSKLETAKEKALNKKEALERKMKEAKDDLIDINDKIDNAEKALNDAILDAADGNRAQRRGENNFNERFTFDETTNAITAGSDKVRKKDVRYAILAYRNAKDDTEKTKWATRFQNLYEALSEEDKKDSNLKAAYGIICG